MAASKKSEALVQLETKLDGHGADLAELRATMARIELGIAELTNVARQLVVQQPRELTADEVAEIVESNPSAKFMALRGHRDRALTPGQVFEWRTRFKAAELVGYVRGKQLSIARAA